MIKTKKHYFESKREEILQKNKERYENRKQETYTCELCGISLVKWNKTKHEKIKRHQQALNKITNNEENISDNIS